MTVTFNRISEGAWAFASGQLRGDDRQNLKLLLRLAVLLLLLTTTTLLLRLRSPLLPR